MGRHRRATPDAPEPVVHDTPAPYGAHGAPDGGARRRAAHRGRRAAPVRTGLLGASAAVAMGAVAVTSGVIPGPGGYTVADSQEPGSRVRADGPSDLATQGGPSSPPAQEDRAEPAERAEADRTAPSASPAGTEAAEKPAPSPTPKRDKPAPDRAEKEDEPKEGDSPPPAEDIGKPPPETGSGSQGAETAAEAEVLTLVNQERARAGCKPVTADPTLAGFAAEFSADMAARGFFSHDTPDGKSPWDRAEAAGIDGLGGENIARGQANAQSVMDSWMNSPGHRANILNCDYRTMGVGAHFAPGGPWWTQNFGF